MVKDKTLYDRLEVDPNAPTEQIKKNFFKLSKQWHPDKHLDENDKLKATQKFKEINEAKEILLDEQKRNVYNQIGMDILNNGGQVQQNEFNPFSGGHNFENMFNQHFSFNMGGMGQHQKREEPPENIVEKLDVTLEQLYNEETINFNYRQNISCTKCDGEGYKDGKSPICKACNGKGMTVQVVRMGNMIQQNASTCHNCRGTGKIVSDEDKCENCSGNCYLIKDKTIQIPLKSGLTNDNKITLTSKGHQLKNCKTNLIICINEIQHPFFKRQGDDLFIEMELKLYQALFGFHKIIKHLDNREIIINCNEKTDFNMIRKIEKEGMKSLHNDNRGNIYIKFNINLPNIIQLPLEAKSQIKSILELFDKDEVHNENNIINKQNLNISKLSNCNQNIVNNIYNNLNNKSNEEEQQQQQQQQQHQHQQGVQCNQQ
jgi:DnaJ-class molecular chaperone